MRSILNDPATTDLAVHRGTVVVSTMASDAHTWNLVFLQLLIEELGYRVRNLGPCVPDDVLVDEVRRSGADLVVLSSVNGHGFQDGMRVIPELRACPELSAVPMVIGGKLGVDGAGGDSGALVDAGFDAVFSDDQRGIETFRALLTTLPARPPVPDMVTA
ncbi:cobalamin B12-binding domain-containing protein [Actinoplanes subglobosus]|uniref:Cobalamin B12-binding domain-containing protein n=1 Tax=Actinoplanes subglobosus TaxID=1547892 RepID=A0ABV8IYK8_9ACTN